MYTRTGRIIRGHSVCRTHTDQQLAGDRNNTWVVRRPFNRHAAKTMAAKRRLDDDGPGPFSRRAPVYDSLCLLLISSVSSIASATYAYMAGLFQRYWRQMSTATTAKVIDQSMLMKRCFFNFSSCFIVLSCVMDHEPAIEIN